MVDNFREMAVVVVGPKVPIETFHDPMPRRMERSCPTKTRLTTIPL